MSPLGRFRQLFGDIFVAVGAAFLVLSLFLTAIFFLASMPEANPYVAALVSILLFVFFIAGGVLFFVGVIIEHKKQS